ncbi:hypothetical protein [Sporichthya polymorpha]|uniref:hypothetical protein n=1 Tax=Sporichthya polymorpha TaxID=35751 RepID=UPI00039D3907|nr:hypothetical protein [Sporichthya polymorpha]
MTAGVQTAVSTARRTRVHLDDAGPLPMRGVLAAVADSAAALGLGGFARTDAYGLTVEIEGPAEQVAHFLARIAGGPLGACWSPGGELAPLGATEFAVLAVSAQRTAATAHRGSDVALCPTCVDALFDKTSPHFLDPTVGCSVCRRGDVGAGAAAPRSELRLTDPAGRPIEGVPLRSAMALLLVGGRIVATLDADRTRLYADATRPAAVAALTAAAGPAGSVVALCPDLEWARRLAVVDDDEAAALASRRSPVLLLEPHLVGPARDLVPTGGPLPVTLPGCGLTHLLARAAARPLAYLDRPAGADPGPAVGILFAEPVI